MKFELENIFKDGIEDEWDEYVNEVANEYCICVDNHTTEFELWCYDDDLAQLFTDFGIGIGNVVDFAKKFDFDEDTYEPLGIEYGDYLETVELRQNRNTYLCRVYCAHNGVGADYAFALFDIERKINMRIEENNKPQFTKDIEALLRKTRACQDIEITYGYLTHEPAASWNDGHVIMSTDGRLFKRIFHPSEKNITCYDKYSETVQIKADGKTFYQSVEGDSYYGMVLDIIQRLREERV